MGGDRDWWPADGPRQVKRVLKDGEKEEKSFYGWGTTQSVNRLWMDWVHYLSNLIWKKSVLMGRNLCTLGGKSMQGEDGKVRGTGLRLRFWCGTVGIVLRERLR